MEKRKVIVVTDGDRVAKKAVEAAAKNIGGRTISRSSGNPTKLDSGDLVDMVKKAANDPVVVMVDDCGDPGVGVGERILRAVVTHPDIDVLGVIAIASNTEGDEGVEVKVSITRDGQIIDKAVDKNGEPKGDNVVIGDTLSVLNKLNVPLIIGMGDPGKMDHRDDIEKGSPITTKAMKHILENSNLNVN